jgi:hypothetical protein
MAPSEFKYADKCCMQMAGGGSQPEGLQGCDGAAAAGAKRGEVPVQAVVTQQLKHVAAEAALRGQRQRGRAARAGQVEAGHRRAEAQQAQPRTVRQALHHLYMPIFPSRVRDQYARHEIRSLLSVWHAAV